MRKIKKYKFVKVYDLQNSKRTSFYKKILFPKATSDVWSSTETTLPEGTSKIDFDKDSVLNRFEHQLNVSGINTDKVTKPDFSWSCEDISEIKKKYNLNKMLYLYGFHKLYVKNYKKFCIKAVKRSLNYLKINSNVSKKFLDDFYNLLFG